MPRGTSESKRCNHIGKNGNQCKRWATKGSDLCRGHAAAAGELTRFKPGPAHPNYKHGRYSKALPERMRQVAEAAEKDPELLNQRSEIALLTARLTEQLKNVDSRTSGELWAEIQSAAAEFEYAISSGGGDFIRITAAKLLKTIKTGGADHAAWEDIRATVLDKNKIITSERKRLVEMQAFVTAEQGMVMIGRLAYAAREALDKYVPDPRQRRKVMDAIALEMERYTKPATETDAVT